MLANCELISTVVANVHIPKPPLGSVRYCTDQPGDWSHSLEQLDKITPFLEKELSHMSVITLYC